MAQPKTDVAQANGAPASQPRNTLDADLALLQSLLAQGQNDESEADVAEILRRLETADGIATGLESRLDDIMGNINTMLGVLEPQGRVVEHESVMVEEERIVAIAATGQGEQEQAKQN
ncbi:uncharacterized protein C8Q71DRAFT_598392 [Rhodofomes roseus]|uniref:Uncharacterized protein n=1 Tax=Rhodofomes roseus TaxID=34475 RepID=A0ABQ8KHM1_9APHY|nr:uncharacterized protein C8Q71DRAFT_598392 [Rhodofomes roseus]KAH9837363.1 hypothetical protein C8Q71DRAFT_598392 [Rhodofomes roseus]